MIGTHNVRTEEITFPEKTVFRFTLEYRFGAIGIYHYAWLGQMRPKIIYLPAQKVIIIWKFVSYKYIMVITSVIFY